MYVEKIKICHLLSLIPLFTLTLIVTIFLTGNSYSNEIKSVKIIEWGWNTPAPTYVKEHIQEMEQLPFDGLGLDLRLNDAIPTPYTTGWNNLFSWNVWGPIELKDEDYSQSIEALKNTNFTKFTDNFLRFNVTPGTVDWYDEEFESVIKNAKLAAEVAKSSGLSGLLFDVELYMEKVFDYSSQKYKDQHTFNDYQKQARKRGQEFMTSINSVYPSIKILLTFGYPVAYFQRHSLATATPYGLLPAFLDGMLEVASPHTLIFDGAEFSYGYTTEQEFRWAYNIIKNGSLQLTKVKERFLQHYRASFALWLDYGRVWDKNDFTTNRFSPEGFESSLRLALQQTDRYVWIYSEKANWWNGGVPQPYINALIKAHKH